MIFKRILYFFLFYLAKRTQHFFVQRLSSCISSLKSLKIKKHINSILAYPWRNLPSWNPPGIHKLNCFVDDEKIFIDWLSHFNFLTFVQCR